MSRKIQKTCLGCGRAVSVSKNKIAVADHYVCGAKCSQLIKKRCPNDKAVVIQLNACGWFSGISFVKADKDQCFAISRANLILRNAVRPSPPMEIL